MKNKKVQIFLIIIGFVLIIASSFLLLNNKLNFFGKNTSKEYNNSNDINVVEEKNNNESNNNNNTNNNEESNESTNIEEKEIEDIEEEISEEELEKEEEQEETIKEEPVEEDKKIEDEEIDINRIILNKQELNLFVGSSETLKITTSPFDATNTKISWSSSDNKVASVDNNGKVTALKEGKATITAKTDNGKTATCTITSVIKEDVYTYFYNPGVKSDAILIKSGNKTMIIDGGVRKSGTVTNDFVNYIKSLGINKVDVYVGTHGHPDHVAIAGKLIKEFDIKTIYVVKGDIPEFTPIKVAGVIRTIDTAKDWYTETENSNYLNNVYKNYVIALMLKRCQSAEERLAIESATINYLDTNSNSFYLGNSKFTVLNPVNGNWPIDVPTIYKDEASFTNDTKSSSPINMNSLVLRMDRGNTSFLFGADLTEPNTIVSLYKKFGNKLEADVYKNGHHHYRVKTAEGALKGRYNYIKPKYVVMATDTKSQFDSLDIEGINKFDVYSVNCGNVVIKSNGINIEIVSGNKYNKTCNLNSK